MDSTPQDVGFEWLGPDALLELVDELRESGYNIGVPQYLAAQDLVLALIAQGESLDQPPRLARLLGPLLCSSPSEQEDFPHRFEQWLNRMSPATREKPQDDTKAKSRLSNELEDIEKQSKWWQWLSLAVIAVLIVLALFCVIQESDPVLIEAPPSSTPTPNTATIPSPPLEWQTVFAVSLSLPLAVFLAWRLWWLHRARLFLVRRASHQQPQIERISVDGLVEDLFPPLFFHRTAQDFRRYRHVPSVELDIGATVESTARRAGWFTPIYANRRVPPEHLVLVDRVSFGDHQAKLIEEMISRLIQNEVFITGFYFDGDPRICFPMVGAGLPCRLRDVASMYGSHRLIVFSDSEALFNPQTGELETWTQVFESWHERAVLTPEPSEHWGYREQELSQLFFILPATPDGLRALGRNIKGETCHLPEKHPAVPFPEELRIRPQRWLQRDPPQLHLVEEVLASVRRYLGEAAYHWFCACAVYPALHWNLTVYLGYVLQTENDNRLLEPRLLISLARLPWFRQGYMPDWLRARLLSDLSGWQEKRIRSALATLLLTAVQGLEDGLRLEVAVQYGRTASALTKILLRMLSRGSASDSPLQDHVFLDFMSGRRQRKLAVRLPRGLEDLFPGARRTASRFDTVPSSGQVPIEIEQIGVETRDPVTRIFLDHLGMFTIASAVGILVFGLVTLDQDIMFYSSVAVWLGWLWLLRFLLRKQVPRTFYELWSGGLIIPRDSEDLLGQYRDFLKTYIAMIDDQRYSWITRALGLGVALFIAINWQYGVIPQPWRIPLQVLAIVLALMTGYVLGTLVWRMIATAVATRWLSNRFDLNIRPTHPDQCGGLKPLGNLYVAQAWIVLLPGMYSAVWALILSLAPALSDNYPATAGFASLVLGYQPWLGINQLLLVILTTVAGVTIVLPSISISRIMRQKKQQCKKEAANLAEEIAELQGHIGKSGLVDREQSAKIEYQLRLSEIRYNCYAKPPLWPFNARARFEIIAALLTMAFSLTASVVLPAIVGL